MLIHELIYTRILPAIRGLLAHKLSSKGLSQHRIAHLLGVTQPVVHRLLKKSQEEYIKDLEEMGIGKEIVEHYVDVMCNLVLSGNIERFFIVSYSIVNSLALRSACKVYSGLGDFCLNGSLRDPDIEYYKSILYRVLQIPGIERLIPEVGSNLVYMPIKSADIAGVIGLTGRIVRSKDRVVVTGEPAYGGSRHLARVFLVMARYNSSLKLGFNTRHEPSVISGLRELGVPFAITGPHEDEESFWRSMEAVAVKRPLVILDQGGRGLEAINYIFASSIDELITLIKLHIKR
ncbi:MAG: thiamine-phosphate synthase family protein [Desulfurococcaceae archaeon]